MVNDGKIIIQGKEINYESLSDEKLIQLYKELKQREAILYKKIMKYNDEFNFFDHSGFSLKFFEKFTKSSK